jgi:iron complex outermembrane recepter protein
MTKTTDTRAFARLAKTKLLCASAVLALAAGAAFAASAQTPDAATSVGEVVVTAPHYVPQKDTSATKMQTALIETPQSVTVISRDQIDLLDWQNLSQAARYTAGIVGENYGSDTRYDWLTLRGFPPVEYIDGLQAPVGSVSTSGFDLYGAQEVDILKGPSSVLYGLAPPGGIVNVTTRRPDDKFGGSAMLEYGSYDSKQIAADVTGAVNNLVSLRLTTMDRQGGTQADGVNDERFYIAPAATFHLTPKDDLTLLSYYQWDNDKGDGVGFLPAAGVYSNNPVIGKLSPNFNAGDYGYDDFARRQYGVGYDFTHDFGGDLKFEQNLKYFDDHTRQNDIYGAGLATCTLAAPAACGGGTLYPYLNPLTGVQEPGLYSNYTTLDRNSFPFKEAITSFNVDSRLTDKFETGPVTQTVLVGLDYRRYILQSAFGFASAPPLDLAAPDHNLTGIVSPPYSFTDSNETQDQLGVYAQDQIKYDRWVLTLGGREDSLRQYNSGETINNSAFTYRAGLNYVFRSGLAPYIAYATSFQPTPGNAFAPSGLGPAFKPTTGDQVEAGIKFEPKFVPHGVKIFATAAVYDLHQDNVLEADPAHLFFQTQAGKVEVKGVELEAVARIYERFTLNASYAYTDSRVNTVPVTQLTLTPKNQGSLFADYTFQDGPAAGLGGGGGVRYIGSTYGDTGNAWKDPSYTLVDAVLHYDFHKWGIKLAASNLLDHIYIAQCSSEVDCFYGLRRNVTATLTRKF